MSKKKMTKKEKEVEIEEDFDEISTEVFPFVEALKNGADWKVTEGAPMTSVAHRYMSVPLIDQDLAHSVRMHEMGHANWTPADKVVAGAGPDCVDAVEAMRVNFKLHICGVDISKGFIPETMLPQFVDQHIASKNLRAMTLFAMSTAGTNQYTAIRNTLTTTKGSFCRKVVKILDQVVPQIGASPLRWIDTEHWAKRTEELIHVSLLKREEPQPPEGMDKNELDKLHEDGMKKIKGRVGNLNTNPTNQWGRLDFQFPPCPNSIRERYMTRAKHPNTEGTYLREVWRIGTDQQIFGSWRRRKGGSVLLDCSGSMSLSKSDIEELVHSAPAVVVALYSGNSDSGVLRVVVKGGRMADDSMICAPAGGSNCVDGPCLSEWLAKQPQPRIWVSDGLVTGLSDCEAKNLSMETLNTCYKYNIIRVDNVAMAKEIFKKIEVSGTHIHPALRKRSMRRALS